jgi:hypothetical protein
MHEPSIRPPQNATSNDYPMALTINVALPPWSKLQGKVDEAGIPKNKRTNIKSDRVRM